jgi:broad-specificity NMP kinase
MDKKLYEERDEKRDSHMADLDRLREEVKRYFKSIHNHSSYPYI